MKNKSIPKALMLEAHLKTAQDWIYTPATVNEKRWDNKEQTLVQRADEWETIGICKGDDMTAGKPLKEISFT